MTDFPDEIERTLATLPREHQPNPALEDRVVRAVYRRRHWPLAAVGTAVAAALVLLIARPWSPPHKAGVPYVLLLSEPADFSKTTPAELAARRHEYGRWADSLDRLGKLDLEGSLAPPGVVDGLFVIRAANDSDAARIAATCPHLKYGGHIDVRRLIE